jgi:hypothetical protein
VRIEERVRGKDLGECVAPWAQLIVGVHDGVM